MQARLPLWPFALVSVLLALGLSLLLLWPEIDAWWRTPRAQGPSETPQPVRVSVNGVALVVPRDLVRFPGQRRDGEVERLELILTWPPQETNKGETAQKTTLKNTVFLTINPIDDSLDPVRRFGVIYQRYLEPENFSAPPGLTARHFIQGSGYDDEELLYDPISPTAFFVRCAAPIAQAPPACLREFRRSDKLDIVYRFPKDFLGNWNRLDQTISALLAAIGVPER